ncbi:ABC transporter permease [Lactobacillus selangorensis]|uniref:ABC transporter permease n=1 Tax=Lactobacillus selangorensis TaxID=81857 RepID=A0A0R2G6Y4_9LACO|nr:ABC transporter permease subunit [Lactobacillus selangorensis]KRN28650.1 ABC transporter permease [Lactobacillus selangorensis]KRN32940.1 ABC transporter permease [Lactobacillus selangorensis]
MENVSPVAAVTPKKKKMNWNRLLPWVLPVLIIGGWQLASSTGFLASKTFPSPVAVFQDGVALAQAGTLQRNIAISLYRATMGLLIGGSIGFALGVLNGVSKLSRNLTDTSIQMLRTIPHLSLIPLVILAIGIGEPAKISLVSIGVLFPVYINTLHGIRSVDPNLVEMGTSYGLSKWEIFTKIIFPGALPTILMGLRYALGVMWTTLIVAETIASDSGIGYMATNAEDFMDMETIILCIVIYALLGKLSDLIAKNLEILALGWRQAKEAQQ